MICRVLAHWPAMPCPMPKRKPELLARRAAHHRRAAALWNDHLGRVDRALWHYQQAWKLEPQRTESLEAAREAGIEWRRVRPGEVVDVDGVTLEFLAPDSAWTVSLDDPNEASTVVRARYGAVRFLLVGDAEAGEEQWLLDHAPDLAADVLKVGHHGSRTSSTPAFLDAVGARLALISVGSGNRYGHPDAGVIASLAERGAFVLRTDQLAVAIKIANTIRESSGGLPAVQAMGVMLENPGMPPMAQVSMNLVDWDFAVTVGSRVAGPGPPDGRRRAGKRLSI